MTCRNGHDAPRDARGKCKACLKGQNQRKHARHGEKDKPRLRAYYKANREKLKSSSTRARRIRCFGWGVGEFEKVSEEQGGACAVCGQVRRLCADHCHTTGKRRAALCIGCNTRVGFIESSPIYTKALAYIMDWKVKHGR